MRLPVLVTLAITLSAAQDASAALQFSWGNPTPQGNPIRALVMEDDLVGTAVGDFGTTLRTTDGGVTWTDLTDLEAFLPDLEDVILDGSGALLAVGDAPGIFRSTDGGATWTPVANPSTGTVWDLFRHDASTLTAVGDGGRIYRSTDDGATWTLLAGLGGQELGDQWWLDLDRGYVTGPARVRRTTDGGATWAPVPGIDDSTFFTGDIRFLDEMNGWVLVDFDTFRTTDGGATWFSKHGPFGSGPIYQHEALFVDENTRWVGTRGEGAEIWKTVDDGEHWTQQYQDQIVIGVTDLVRLSTGVVLVSTEAGDLLRSTDDGATWTNFSEIRGADYRWSLDLVESRADGRMFAGGGSDWIQSDDYGATWFAPATNPGVLRATAIANHGDTWFVGGSPTHGQSRISHSTDDGATWESVSLSPTYAGDAVSISAPADGVAFAATYGGSSINHVFRTTDSGASWELANTGVPANVRLFAIYFVDASNGYVGGGNFGAGLWRTTDGGDTWTDVGPNGFGNDEITDMYWMDVNTGVAAGLGGVYRTTNGGLDWTHPLTDGFFNLEFENDLHGYVRELGPLVYETWDGGITWDAIDIPLRPSYENVAAVPGGFVTVGFNRTVFRAVESDPADVADGAGSPFGGASPAHPVHAFPNPTLGPTELRFQAETSGVYTVSVFDVSGRLESSWRTFVDGGTGSVHWQAPQSGTWFVRVQTPSGAVQTGRIVRVR
ncbi:MAG: T9SS type A sorting domain-containing protein [Candidatus Eisenbacteria bacterium]